MGHRQILICLFLIAMIPLSAKALPPPSPAGGNYLVLDGVDDYAVLDFETFGYLLPDGTDEFTFEAWIYPTTPPDSKDTLLTILHQQVRMVIVNDEFQPYLNDLANLHNIEPLKGDLILLINAYRFGGANAGRTIPFPFPLALNQWHHIAYQSKGDQKITIVNDLVGIWQDGAPLGRVVFLRPQDFVLGGFGKIIEIPGRPPTKSFGIPSQDILMRFASQRRLVTMSTKKALCQTESSKKTQRRLAYGILMNPVAPSNLQMHRAMHIIWRVKTVQRLGTRLPSKQEENSPPHGEDLSNEFSKMISISSVRGTGVLR